MLGLSLWEGRLPGRKAIENEDKGSHCSYRPESNFGTSDTVLRGPTQSRVTPRAAAPTLTYSRATSREGVLSTHDKP